MTLRIGYETRLRTANLVFDIVDGYARAHGMGTPHPRPIVPLYFYVIERMVNGAAQPIDPPMEMIVGRNPSGYHLFFGAVKMPDGTTYQNILAPGEYTVLIDTQPHEFKPSGRNVPRLYQQEKVKVTLPMPDPRGPAATTPYSVLLTPAPLYPFPHATPLRLDFPIPGGCNSNNMPVGNGPTLLRGNLHQRDGRPLEGITVRAAALPVVKPHTTGPDGGWVLVFAEDQSTGTTGLRFGLPQPDGTVVEIPGPDVCVVHGFECSLSQAALRGWVTDRGRPATQFTLQLASAGGGGPYPNLAVTSPDGGWFYYFDLDQFDIDDQVDVTARLPDGRFLTRLDVPVRPRATVVVPTFQFQ
jgi:hypothetical protein